MSKIVRCPSIVWLLMVLAAMGCTGNSDKSKADAGVSTDTAVVSSSFSTGGSDTANLDSATPTDTLTVDDTSSINGTGEETGASETGDATSGSETEQTSNNGDTDIPSDQVNSTDTASDQNTGTDTALEDVTDTEEPPPEETGQETDIDQDALTVIDITDQVIVENIKRFGINLGGDNYWDSVLKKNRIKNGGFEGVMYRHIARGPGGDDQSFYDWNDYTDSAGGDEISTRTWLDIAEGADAWLLAGDRAYQADVIESVTHSPSPDDNEDVLRFLLEDSGPLVGQSSGTNLDEVGMLIERIETDSGFLGQHGGPLWTFASDNATMTTPTGNNPPDSRGSVVASLEAPGSETAKLMFPLVPSDKYNPNGTWRVNFWARGDGTLTVGHGPWGDPRDPFEITISNDWQYFEETMTVSDFTDDSLNLHLSATGGTVMIDDVSAYKEGDDNPTAFNDQTVNLMHRLRPGSLRYLFMGGSSVENMLRPDHERMAVSFRREIPHDPSQSWPPHPGTNGGADIIDFNMHDFLTLSEEIGAEPWYCVSGTILPDEMVLLMEYLAGGTDTPGGQIRSTLGRDAPWTDAFSTVHIEMGNEAWNWASAYAYGGWNGPEYWSTLFNTAKESLVGMGISPDGFMFHMGAQNYNTWLGGSLVDYHGAAADAYSIAPYVIHDMSTEQAALDDERLFAWAFGWVWHLNTGGPMQANADMIANAGHAHLQFSVYEVNHHITGGDADNDARNKIVTSIGGALNVINHMLLMVERYSVRTQNFFSLFQESYDGVGLWGSVLSTTPGQERYRPTFMSLVLANEVLNGDMVDVQISGANETWPTSFEYDGETIVTEMPYIHAYATRNGQDQGLILLNLHPTTALPVQINLPAPAGSAAIRSHMTAPNITSNNEWGHDPEVTIDEATVSDFADGHQRLLPPHSMTVLQWDE